MGKDVSFYTAFTLSESYLLVAEEQRVRMNTSSPVLSSINSQFGDFLYCSALL